MGDRMHRTTGNEIPKSHFLRTFRLGGACMARCDVCGNEYDKSFELIAGGKRHVFDSFECAIQAIAPVCAHCGCKVISHGSEAKVKVFCCAHCARAVTKSDLRDRAA